MNARSDPLGNLLQLLQAYRLTNAVVIRVPLWPVLLSAGQLIGSLPFFLTNRLSASSGFFDLRSGFKTDTTELTFMAKLYRHEKSTSEGICED